MMAYAGIARWLVTFLARARKVSKRKQPAVDFPVLASGVGKRKGVSRLPPGVSHSADNAGKTPPAHPPYAGFADLLENRSLLV